MMIHNLQYGPREHDTKIYIMTLSIIGRMGKGRLLVSHAVFWGVKFLSSLLHEEEEEGEYNSSKISCLGVTFRLYLRPDFQLISYSAPLQLVAIVLACIHSLV